MPYPPDTHRKVPVKDMNIGQVRQWEVSVSTDQYGFRGVEMALTQPNIVPTGISPAQARGLAALLEAAAEEVERAEQRDERKR